MNNEGVSKEAILENLVHILKDMTSEWDLAFSGSIGPETGLIADLEFSSIDIVQFIVAIEGCFKRRGLPYEELVMVGGRYVDEIKVGDTVEFLYRNLNNHKEHYNT